MHSPLTCTFIHISISLSLDITIVLSVNSLNTTPCSEDENFVRLTKSSGYFIVDNSRGVNCRWRLEVNQGIILNQCICKFKGPFKYV